MQATSNKQTLKKSVPSHVTPLPRPPENIERFKEIAVQHHPGIAKLWNELTPAERILAYYLYRASLPGNRIDAQQIHRNSLALFDIFETIVAHEGLLTSKKENAFLKQFVAEAKTFLTYLWTNHSQYFQREHANEKRTPARLGLDTLTQENLTTVLLALQIPDAVEKIKRVASSLFDPAHETTITIPGDIEKSAGNIYPATFTEADYNTLPASKRTALNAYFYFDAAKKPALDVYKAGSGRCGRELEVSLHWLKKAHVHAQKHPKAFDEHIVKSLSYLIDYVTTGDEEHFKKHSIEWAQTNSRLDYTWGFIETYDDPKSHRGMFQADITIKSLAIDKLNKLLPSIEAKLPVQQEWKRDGLDNGKAAMPNASINTKLFASGKLGPMEITAAYCLPNYEEIRSTYGSKQIIYQSGKGLGELVNKELSRKLGKLKRFAEWTKKHDTDNKLPNILWDVQCILHETIGHASGKLAKHTFVEGDKLTIDGTTYKLGDTIEVTNANVRQLLAGYEQTIEELRAEIIALYVSIAHLDELIPLDLFKGFEKKLSKEELEERLILNMMNGGLMRLRQQSEGATIVSGDHARANQTIMNFMCDGRGIVIKKERVLHKGTTYDVIGCEVKDMKTAIAGITELFKLVQHIKSTGDGVKARELVEKYGVPLNREHFEIMKCNHKATLGDLKARAFIYPALEPVANKDGEIVDVQACWPDDIFEENFGYKDKILSTE